MGIKIFSGNSPQSVEYQFSMWDTIGIRKVDILDVKFDTSMSEKGP